MAKLSFRNLRHSYAPDPQSAADYALAETSLEFADGGAYALLGPSGCGKTTLLNILSGLVAPSEGRVLFDDVDVTDLPTEQRNIAQVFQFPVVYDHMTVRENIAFPLRNRGVKGDALVRRVDEILEMTGLAGLANRKAKNLSAEFKQKVSLGRGLVRDDVAAILFDEPLTVIDPQIKWELRTQLKALHRRSGRTMVYVTHDQTEALTFADKVVVMLGGEVIQVGSPDELFDRPDHTFVGYFIGSPGMNVLPVSLDGRSAHLGGQSIELPGGASVGATGQTELGVRPEHVLIGEEGMPIQTLAIEDRGRTRVLRARLEGHDIAALLREGQNVPADPRIRFDQERLHLYRDSRRVDWEGAGR